ncbi:hypothetical protein ACU4GD_31945 [Cupriavidus basilensis]
MRMVNLSLQYGNGDESSLAYAWFGMLVTESDAKMASGFAALAMELSSMLNNDRTTARVLQIVGGNLMHWTHPLRVARCTVRSALDLTEKTGDRNFASYLHSGLITQALATGETLSALQSSIESGSEAAWGAQLRHRSGSRRSVVTTCPYVARAHADIR